jgi:hypothetical protein
MQTIVTESDLRIAILELESRQAEECILMKAQFLVAVESIKPINLIKSAFIEATESEDIQDNFVNSSIGLSAGYISKMLFQGISHGPFRKIIGTAVMFGIKNLVAQNPDTIKTGGRIFFRIIRDLLSSKDKKARNIDARETTGS